MKRNTVLSILVLLSMVLVALPAPMMAQEVLQTEHSRKPYTPPATPPDPAPAAPQPDWTGTWQYGPDSTFAFTRFDGEYYPGDGLVYFMGGRLASGNTPDTDGSVWSFDPATGAYADTGVDLVTPVSNYQMNLLQDGSGDWGFYILCGRPAGGGTTNAVQVYYPDTNTAVQLDAADDFPGPGCTSGLNAVYNNEAWVAGGFDPALTPSNWDYTYVFDPTAAAGSKWTLIPSATLSLARAYIMSAVVDDMIYAIGGNWFDGGSLINVTTVEVLDPNAATPAWDDVGAADLPETCSASRAWGFDSDSPYTDPDGTSLAGKIVSGCGNWSDADNHINVYDTVVDFWEAFPYMQTDRRDLAASFVPSGAGRDLGTPGMWVWGGINDDDASVHVSSEYYDVGSGEISCDVLLVQDDWDFAADVGPNPAGLPYYTSTLDYLGLPYTVWDVEVQGDPGTADMSGHDAVVWWTGYAWNSDVFSAQNEADVGAYLDAGGNFLLSAQDYHWEAGYTPFMANYLGIASLSDDVVITVTMGIAGNVVGDGLGPYTMARPDDWYTYWPTESQYVGPYDDSVYGILTEEEAFRYNDAGVTDPNATSHDGGDYRTVYLGWPFEWIDTVEERAEIMGSALGWLCAPRGDEVQLQPPYQQAYGVGDEVKEYDLFLTNNTGQVDSFDITYTGNAWSTAVPAVVGPLTHGEMVSFTVEVAIPSDVLYPASDTVYITATAQSSPYDDMARIETETMAAVDGHIYDLNTGAPLVGYVTIYDANDPDLEIGVTSDANGYYVFQDVGLQIRSYDMYGAAIGYDRVDLTLDLTGEQTTTVDFDLAAAMMDVAPTAIDTLVAPDRTKTVPLNLGNDGTADLLFRIDEVAPGTGFPVPETSMPRPEGVDAQVYTDLTASPDGSAEVLVVMAEQADLSAAEGIADWSSRGHYVYNTLKATADRSQAGTIKYLEGQGIAYHSHISLNSLSLSASLETVEALAAMPAVRTIQPGYTFEIPEPIVEEAIESPEAVPWNITNIEADEVWQVHGVTGENIVVANIDTGVEWTHEALQEQYRGWDGATADHNYNWWDPRGACEIAGYPADEPCDNDSHGTHTMGSIVGSTDPANPISATYAIGVAPGAEWIACKGCEYVEGWPCSTFALLECADFMLAPWDIDGLNPDPDMRPHVVNNSWGGGPTVDGWYFNDAIAAWRASGIFSAFSAGNEGPNCGTAGAPGNYYNNFATGAVNINDDIAGFSSRGPTALGVLKPQVTAPGVQVNSSVPGGGYAQKGGTSMASPHSAGEVALIWSAQPELVGQVQITEWLMMDTAEAITTTEECGGIVSGTVPNNTYGWGRINAYDAVESALAHDWDVEWLDVSPGSGTVAPGGDLVVDVTLDATGMVDGDCFAATLKIETNDPYLGLDVFVPVDMCVGVNQYYLPIILRNE